MLHPPRYGKVDIYIGNQFLGSAINKENVPVILLDTFLSYFLTKQTSPSVSFAISFPAAKGRFGIIEFGNNIYIIENITPNSTTLSGRRISPLQIGLPLQANSDDIIRIIAKECIEDIQRHSNEWAKFYIKEGKNEETAIQDNSNKITNYLFVLERLMNKKVK